MKKNVMCFIGILVVLAACLIVFFRPMPLLRNVSAENQILITVCELGIRNGEAYIDSDNYGNVTGNQKDDILAVLDKYSCKRTVGTIFSNGSMSGLGEKLIYIYIYKDTSLVEYIGVSSAGKVAIDERTYKMRNADQFISQITEILDE